MTTQIGQTPTGKPIHKIDDLKAHTRYKTKAGKAAVGVTTAIGVMDKPGLLPWAWQLGVDGISLEAARNQAATVGTIGHFISECYLRGWEPDLSNYSKDQISLAENCALKFIQFWDEGQYKLVASEMPLVHEELCYGGTLDIVATDKDGKLVLVDLKTSKAIYSENWIQVAAYKELWEYHNPDKKITRVTVARIGKEESLDFEVQHKENTAPFLDVFHACLNLYRARAAMKKVA